MSRHLRDAAVRTQVCGGFDGSDSDDWTAIRLETLDGFMFTPRFGPDRRPTIWDPAEHGGKIPRAEVKVAMDEIFSSYLVERMYCDPFDWRSEIEAWSIEFGEEHVFMWDTGRGNTRVTAVWAALERFKTDLSTGALTHDDCPITKIHMANTRKVPKPGEKYTIGKKSPQQKIDSAMTSVICHEAACDARAAGWSPPEPVELTVWR